MIQNLETEAGTASSSSSAQARREPVFHYQMADIKARKIATIIKFSKLPYLLEQAAQPQDRSCCLQTHYGELCQEYEIIQYVVNDSFLRNNKQGDTHIDPQSMFGSDIFVWAKMSERLYQLRKTLFPLLQEYYRYLLGHEKVRRAKYVGLSNRVRREIFKLDQQIAQQSDIFGPDYSFLNIVIACELWIGCKFAFQEKFRKSKAKLFGKCQKISKCPQFQELYGKASFCVRECLQIDFQEQQQVDSKQEESLPTELVKIAQPWTCQNNQKRNQLLYDFFRSTLKGHEPKHHYFPYFWLMYDSLLCTLVQLNFEAENAEIYSEVERVLLIALQELGRITKPDVDYGFLGLYLNQKTKKYELKGLICLAQHSFDELIEGMWKQSHLKKFQAAIVDVQCQEQRKRVEMLWEYRLQGVSFEDLKPSLIRQF